LKASKTILIMISLFLVACIVIFPAECIAAAKDGLAGWLNIIVPSLLPFMIGSNILLRTGILKPLAEFCAPFTKKLFGTGGDLLYIYVSSALSGYPMGAKLAGDLYKEGDISHNDAVRIINATSISGPLFISGAVATSILNNPAVAEYIYFPHILSALAVGVLFHIFVYPKNMQCRQPFRTGKTPPAEISVGKVLNDSIMNSLKTIGLIGGFIILFSVFTAILDKLGAFSFLSVALSPLFHLLNLNSNLTPALVSGMLEMSNGCIALASVPDLLTQKILVSTFIITFSGLSIFFQTYSILSLAGIKNRYFIPAKITQSVVAVLLCVIFLNSMAINVGAFPSAHAVRDPRLAAAVAGVLFLAACLLHLAFRSKKIRR
jgi:sporulation integral membrane protein YlbJ